MSSTNSDHHAMHFLSLVLHFTMSSFWMFPSFFWSESTTILPLNNLLNSIGFILYSYLYLIHLTVLPVYRWTPYGYYNCLFFFVIFFSFPHQKCVWVFKYLALNWGFQLHCQRSLQNFRQRVDFLSLYPKMCLYVCFLEWVRSARRLNSCLQKASCLAL